MKSPRANFPHVAALAAAVVVLSVTLSGHDALSQTSRTIKIVVPWAPGGATDVLARLAAEQIGRVQGLTMLVENRAGAGSMIGTEAVARAAPDGNTLLINTTDLLIGPHLRKLNYDPLTSLEPICYLASLPQVCFANPYYRPSPQASDEAVNAPRRPGGERYPLPGESGRRVGALQSRGVRAKQSTSTVERTPGGRLDAGATEAQVPKQETWSFPLADVIAASIARVVSAVDDRPEARPPAALMFPGLSSPKTPE